MKRYRKHLNNVQGFYKFEKAKMWIGFYIFSLIIALTLSLAFCILPTIANLLFNRISFISDIEFIMSFFSLIGLEIIIILLPISYKNGNIIVNDKSIIFTRPIIGKTIEINLDDILAFKHIYKKSSYNHILKIFLKNGKKIKISNPYIQEENFYTLLNLISGKVKNEVHTKKDIKNLDFIKNVECKLNRSWNFIPLLKFLIAIIVTIIIFIPYFSGYNKKGEQKEINMSGSVYNKSIEHNKSTDTYRLFIQEDKTNKIYQVNVDPYEYDEYSLKDKLIIHAKKGSLGILYDINIESN